MTEFSYISAFFIGLAGGVHCLGMCGSITLAMRAASPVNSHHFPFALSYHTGRVISYSVAGAFTGLLGGMVSTASHYGAVTLQLISIVMLILMALYLGQWYRGLTRLEQLGAHLWKKLQPVSKRFIPFRTPLHALPYGMIWGWLPCGLVYSTLTWSLASQSMQQGFFIMLAFGLGTFPVMLLASAGASSLATLLRHAATRQIIAVGLIMYAFTLLFFIL
ncbi:sulfite exporter TauE/SafE family protein [Alteromonas sediminis]|uniref:Sulfite exporter TauE/SafE family protein n=1 Tax=Alteromonas sediminis TaxID=2259342 RepID=A0A3N5YD56_9ALTE|nr:sulfite exporter TauE/SafE family protein [Alteromonas sediminis]RPJ67405.1 sulfite exporter TauE/SafE family protein [Alteromonas sediminis]